MQQHPDARSCCNIHRNFCLRMRVLTYLLPNRTSRKDYEREETRAAAIAKEVRGELLERKRESGGRTEDNKAAVGEE